jgi:hypothetical protein
MRQWIGRHRPSPGTAFGFAISWSAGSEPRAGVVARAAGAGPVTSNSPQPFDVEAGTPVPLTGQASTDATADARLLIRQHDNYVYEPETPDSRTLTATAADTCQDGNHFTVDSVKVSVNGIR